MRRSGTAVIAGLATLLAAAPAATAVGTVHFGRIVFPEPHNPPSIGVPPPPLVQTRESTRAVTIRYDASAGTVSLRVEVFDPALWGEQINESFELGPRCITSYYEEAVHPPEFTASMRARPKRFEGGREFGGVEGEATLRGYQGHVNSTGVFNGRYFEITLTSRAFRNRPWRCALLTSDGSPQPYVPLSGWRRSKPHPRSH
jgi:hypothetical protein